MFGLASIGSWLLNFFGSKAIEGLVDAYKAKQVAATDSERIAADVATRELLVETREAELKAQLQVAEIGHWYEPTHLFAYIMVSYFGKIVVWDKVLGDITQGSTDALAGDAATWAGMIMAFYLGKRGIENVARILKR